MRNGIVAIVPLFLGVVILFFVILFIGGSGDTLFQVNNVTKVNHLQSKMLIPAAKYADVLEKAGDTNVSGKVDEYIEKIMKQNLQHN